MPADDGWTTVSNTTGVAAITNSWSTRPVLSVIDILLMLWRMKWLIAFVALPVIALAAGLALMMPKEYRATSRIQVTAGAERVFNPLVSDATATVMGQQEITASEVELIRSPVIVDRVIKKIGLEVIAPDMYRSLQKLAPIDQPLAYEKAVIAVQKSFSAGAAPKNPVIYTSYKNENPQVAADVLNTLVETYIQYRAELFAGGQNEFLTSERMAASDKLAEADSAIERFLVSNRIGDFETEKESISKIYASVTDELYSVQAERSEVEGSLSATVEQLYTMEPTIDLVRETTHEQELFALKVAREELLAIYLPDTPQVLALDRQIDQIQTLITEQGQSGARVQRGPNPIYEAVESRRTELGAQASALSERFAELERQKTKVERRQLELTKLEPRYQVLVRQRAILENQVRGLTVREEEERLKQNAARINAENIQILEPARLPAKAESKRKLVIMAGVIFGLGTGGLIALILIFTKSTLPTANSVARTSGLPVLASVRKQ